MTTPADLPELPRLPDQGFMSDYELRQMRQMRQFIMEYGQACYAAGVRAGMERAAVIAESEKLNDPNTESEGDAAYDLAIDHCAAAIRAAKHTKQQTE